jgi:hypothetical protein
MASRTQLRLAQLTGSFGTGAINDQITQTPTGSANLDDLEGVLSHLAGAIKRIHGDDSFSESVAGRFHQDIRLKNDKKLQFHDNGMFIHGSADGELLLSSDGTATNAIDIDATAGGIDIDAGTSVAINSTTTTVIGATTTVSVTGNTGASFGDDTGTWEFDGSGAVTETGMTSLAVTPSAAITLTAGAASTFSTSAGNFTLDSAAANLVLDGHTGVLIDATSTGNVEINAAAGSIEIGNDDINQAINIGGDGNRTITIGESGGASTVAIHSDAANMTLDAGSNNVAITGGLTVSLNSTLAGNLEVGGNLTVTGDTTTTYITSSVVELQDPVLVTNAADMSTSGNAAKSRKAGTSFLSASSDIENAAGTQAYDYGLVYKRAIGYNAEGAGNGVSQNGQIPSLAANVEGGNPKFDTTNIGSVFGVFKTTGFDGGGNIAPAGGIRDLILDPQVVRNGANNKDILGAHLGAFCAISSSAGSGKKRFGVIDSVTSNRVKINVLKSTERYDGLQLSDEIESANMGTANDGSIQLLSAYAGTIFDKEGFEFHHAAAAITGSGDNKFISGSANIMLYGGINSAKMTLHQNNLVSGSLAIGDFDLAAESDESAVTFTRLQSQNAKDLMLKSAGDLILSASTANGRVRMVTNDGSTIKFPVSAGTTNQIMKIGASAGQLEFASLGSLIPADARSVFTVKPSTTIAAGTGGLILTASVAANSVHFEQLQAGVPANIATQINALTDAELFNRVSVFVNGQLLASGSGTAAGVTAGADYTLKRIAGSSPAQISGSFAFDLEEDDIITIVAQSVT